MTSYLVTALGVCALSGVAQAGFFSFASDSNPDGPTFISAAPNGIRDGRSMDLSGRVRVNLMYDADEDGPAAPGSIDTAFGFTGTTYDHVVVPIGGQFMHIWGVLGGYQFESAPGSGRDPEFACDFGEAVMISWSDSPTMMGTSASIADESAFHMFVTLPGGGQVTGDFSFTLTNLKTLDGGRVPINPDGSFGAGWKAEGSWSAHTIPAPASLSVMGAAAAVGRRRKR